MGIPALFCITCGNRAYQGSGPVAFEMREGKKIAPKTNAILHSPSLSPGKIIAMDAPPIPPGNPKPHRQNPVLNLIAARRMKIRPAQDNSYRGVSLLLSVGDNMIHYMTPDLPTLLALMEAVSGTPDGGAA